MFMVQDVRGLFVSTFATRKLVPLAEKGNTYEHVRTTQTLQHMEHLKVTARSEAAAEPYNKANIVLKRECP